MAQETAGLKKVGTVSIDGTKIKANASKHAAVSYQRAGEQIELLRKEVEQLTAKAEEIDNVPLDEGLSIPQEIARREDRIKSLEQAREVIKERYAEERKEKQAEYEEKMARHEEKRKKGKKRGRRPPSPPPEEPPGSMQYNFTDPESRIMKAGGSNFEQAFNAQAAVDTDTFLVVGQFVTDAPTDKQQLNPTLERIPEQVAQPQTVLADTGYYGEGAIEEAESNDGPMVYCALAKSGHRLTVSDLEKKPRPEAPPDGAPHEGADGLSPPNARRKGALQVTQADGRTGLRNHQGGTRLPPLLHEGSAEGPNRMVPCLLELQLEEDVQSHEDVCPGAPVGGPKISAPMPYRRRLERLSPLAWRNSRHIVFIDGSYCQTNRRSRSYVRQVARPVNGRRGSALQW